MRKEYLRRNFISLLTVAGASSVAACNAIESNENNQKNDTATDNKTEDIVSQESDQQNNIQLTEFETVYRDWINFDGNVSSEEHMLVDSLSDILTSDTVEEYEETVRAAETSNSKSSVTDSHKLIARSIKKAIMNNSLNIEYHSSLDVIYYSDAVYPVGRHFFNGYQVVNIKYAPEYTRYGLSSESSSNFLNIENVPAEDRVYHTELNDLSTYEEIARDAFDDNYNSNKFSSSPPPAAIDEQSSELSKVAERGIMSRLKAYSSNLFLSDLVEVPYLFTYRSNTNIVPWDLQSHLDLQSSLNSQSQTLWKSAVRDVFLNENTEYMAIEVNDGEVELHEITNWQANYPGVESQYEYRIPGWEYELSNFATNLLTTSSNGENIGIIVDNSNLATGINIDSGDKIWEYETRNQYSQLVAKDGLLVDFDRTSVQRIDANSGRIVWSNTVIDGNSDEEFSQIGLITEDTIYIYSLTTVFCIERDSGEVRWQKNINVETIINSVNGNVYVKLDPRLGGQPDSIISVDSSTGETNWQLQKGSFGVVRISAGYMYIGVNGPSRLYRIDLDSEDINLTPHSNSEGVDWVYEAPQRDPANLHIYQETVVVDAGALISLNKDTGEVIWSTEEYPPGTTTKTSDGIFAGGFVDDYSGSIIYGAMYDPSSGEERWEADFYGISQPEEFQNKIYMNDSVRLFGYNLNSGDVEWSYFPQQLEGISDYDILGDKIIVTEENLVVGFDLS